MNEMIDEEEEDDRSFFERHRGIIFTVVLAGVAIGMFFVARSVMNTHGSSVRRDDMMMVRLPPPPPPPKLQPTPPPKEQPTPEQKQDQKMVEQAPTQNEKKDAPKDKPDDRLQTTIKGPGGTDFGLGYGSGGGGGYGGSGGEGGSKYGWYASEVQTRIAEVLRNNPATNKASMKVVVRIWPDSTGRITKARLQGSTGNPSLDATLQNDILTGMQLSDPPPADMPLPIVMRVSAQRPE